MSLKKNIKVGNIKLNLFVFKLTVFLLFSYKAFSNDLEGTYTDIKVLDKISSKNISIKIKNGGDEIVYKDLSIRVMKCKNSEFDDNPEVTAYIQVKDLTKKNKNEVFVFNGWMFSSSPSIAPFDHPVYDIWLESCY